MRENWRRKLQKQELKKRIDAPNKEEVGEIIKVFKNNNGGGENRIATEMLKVGEKKPQEFFYNYRDIALMDMVYKMAVAIQNTLNKTIETEIRQLQGGFPINWSTMDQVLILKQILV